MNLKIFIGHTKYIVAICFLLALPRPGNCQNKKLAEKAREAMFRATKYMVDSISTNGGYVELYRDDLTRRWSELEAYKTQVKVEDPGTVGMGNTFLDAYAITGDEYYYKAAEAAANALIWGQLPCGGWNYSIDFAGDRSLKEWYRTIGKNAWGFEEHYYYRGNATFDDNVTTGAAKFLLRIYLEKLDPKFKPALDRAIVLILESQYPLGGWPQRYPLQKDYSSYYTFNDHVTAGNLELLVDCYVTLGEERFLDPIRRAMNFYLITQHGNPQGGWAQQYNMDLQPAQGRTYEPAALNTRQTYENINLLFKFYRYTGDRRFLARVPDAIAWLESARLDESLTDGGKRTHPFFVELGTNKPLWMHRTGHGVKDGVIKIDYNTGNLYAYGLNNKLNTGRLKDEYTELISASKKEVTKGSPLLGSAGKMTGSEYFREQVVNTGGTPEETSVNKIIDALNKNRWLSMHEWISSPYSVSASGEESNTARHSELSSKYILDPSDQQYISVAVYIKNMKLLTDYLAKQKKSL